MYLFFWMCYSIRLTWRISRKLNNVASIWLKIINTHVIIILFWTRQHILYCFVLYRHSQKSQIYTIFLDIWTVLVHNCVFSPLKSRVYATFPSSIFHWSNSVTVYPVRPYHESPLDSEKYYKSSHVISLLFQTSRFRLQLSKLKMYIGCQNF